MKEAVKEPVPYVLCHYLRVQEGEEELLAVLLFQLHDDPHRTGKTPAQNECHSDHERKDEAVESGRIQILYHMFSSFLYILLMLRIMCLVFMPLGHTIMHFPQSMHADSIFATSSFLPLRR